MVHIVVLSKDYFPDKLKNGTSKDRVVVIASANDSIPVSAYQNEIIRNMEVKLLPDIKNAASAEGKNGLLIAQAMLIGQLTASEKDFEIYTDDAVLLSAITSFTGKKALAKKTVKKASTKKNEVEAAASVSEVEAIKPKESSEKKAKKTPGKKTKENKAIEGKEVKADKPKKEAFTSKIKEVAKTSSKTSTESAKKAAKLPTLAQIKNTLGATNSVHAKTLLNTLKKSNQVTFEMNARIELAKAGLDASVCQELAKMVNEEFGKALPTA